MESQIILASFSPRRTEIMRNYGIELVILPSDAYVSTGRQINE